MINKHKHSASVERRKARVRNKLANNIERPRLVFNKTNRYLIAQLVDDNEGKTLAFAVSSEKNFPVQGYSRKNKTAAVELGKIIADRIKSKGITKVKFDRGVSLYHGKLAAFADAAREGGLEF